MTPFPLQSVDATVVVQGEYVCMYKQFTIITQSYLQDNVTLLPKVVLGNNLGTTRFVVGIGKVSLIASIALHQDVKAGLDQSLHRLCVIINKKGEFRDIYSIYTTTVFFLSHLWSGSDSLFERKVLLGNAHRELGVGSALWFAF